MYLTMLIEPSATEHLLHQVSLICVGIQMYPDLMYPHLIEPSATDTYYTRSV